MTAKKYLEKIDCFNTIYLNREKESNTMAKIMESYAKKYHEMQLKLLGIADVSNCSQECEWKADKFDNIGIALTEYCEECGAKRYCC